MPPLNINYLAVLVAGVAAFAVGWLWYSPLLFAKPWMAAHGYTPERLGEMQKRAGRAYGVSAVMFVVMAGALAVLVALLGIGNAVAGLKLGALVWAGFAFPLGLIAHMYSDKPISAFVIDAGYQLVYLLLMGAIIGAWR
jgi:hypothetical protein